ncbi:MAG: tRNA 2-thiouridine(34) synthase MnmA [Spirochaetes bacterium]|nr:tRNA 2-thiouridine(34) synthase MnmA [Spirochaetota bacterium]
MYNNMKTKVAVGMSGGIDSSFAAYKLLEEGYEVIGVTMLGSKEKYEIGKCCSFSDIEDAKLIAKKLNIDHVIVDLTKEFEENVIKPFINDFYNLKTPNPCIICNEKIKFGLLMDYCLENLKVNYFATGHYARIKNKSFISKALDSQKDQSYFLYRIPKNKIEKIIFPCGNFYKKDIKDIIAFNNLINPYSKKESYDICFIKGKDYVPFLLSNSENNIIKNGYFISQEGEIISKHKGTLYYTIGQRKGLNIAIGKKTYIREIKEDGNIIIGEKPFVKSIKITNLNLFLNPINLKEFYNIKIRYRTKEVKCKIDFNSSKLCSNNALNSFLYINILEDVEASAPGQSAVIYDDDIVIGGGIIEKIYLS